MEQKANTQLVGELVGEARQLVKLQVAATRVLSAQVELTNTRNTHTHTPAGLM